MFSSSRGIRIITLVLAVNLVGGCASAAVNNASNNPGTGTSSSATPAVTYDTAPLTGVQYQTGSNKFLAGPVVMGKIDNSPEARPQLALSKTDIVIDEMVEGGLTRFLAIWHSQMPAEFGPIRSVRPMDPDLATAFGGVISYSGGQKPFVLAMKATGIYNADETSEVGKGTMERVTNRVAPHNLFVKAQNMQTAHMSLGAPQPAFSFATDAASSSAGASGKSVLDVKAQFPAATALWTWNGSAFARTQDGKALTDALDGKQLTAQNVLVLRVAVDRSFRDPRYGFVPKTLLEGTGKGTVFSDGKSIDVTWTKTSAKNYVKLTDSAGAEVKLAPGNSWFELVPTDVGKVTVDYPKAATATPTATAKK
jgi:hypothetical protein